MPLNRVAMFAVVSAVPVADPERSRIDVAHARYLCFAGKCDDLRGPIRSSRNSAAPQRGVVETVQNLTTLKRAFQWIGGCQIG